MSHCELIVLPKFHVLSFVRGIVSVFAVWLEQFPADFDDPPKYLSLNRMLHFVTSEVKENHRDELTKKIKHRLDKFRITPYEDEGKTLCGLDLPYLPVYNAHPYIMRTLFFKTLSRKKL